MYLLSLGASRNGIALPAFTFKKPISVTLRYSDADIARVRDDWQLIVRSADGQDATQTCDAPTGYTRDLEQNVLSLAICRTGSFALVGPTHQLLLPFVVR